MKKNFVYLFFILFLCSCISEPQEFTTINPEEEFVLDLNQALSSEGPHLVFEISSVDEFSCDNVEIENILSTNTTSLDLFIERFRIPSGCEGTAGITTVGVAKGSNSVLLNTDNYDFTIRADELFYNSGTITVTDLFFSIQLTELEGIVLGRSSIKKVPANHLWGSLNIESSSLTYDEFSSGLIEYVSKSENLVSGDYGLFSINASDEINFSSLVDDSESSFIFEIDDYNGLENYIQSVRNSFPQIELVITLSNGENL